MKKALFFIILTTMLNLHVYSQSGIRDSSIRIVAVEFGYNSSITLGDLIDRTNWVHGINTAFSIKLPSNFIFSLGGELELGDFNETFDPLKHLKSDVGYVVDKNGELVEINNNYFGYNIFAGIGKIWPSRNFNSGLITSLNFGFWQHKISFIYTGDNIPGLSEEYIKGYDRLANGFMMTQKLGYRRYSPNNMFNFEIGVNSAQGFTAIRRNWIYDEMQAPPANRLDIKLGVYATIMIPIIR